MTITDKRVLRGNLTKEKILNAAIALWASEQGNFTIRQIAEKIGADHPLIYHHFTNVESLKQQAADHAVADFLTEPNADNSKVVALLIISGHEAAAILTHDQRTDCVKSLTEI